MKIFENGQIVSSKEYNIQMTVKETGKQRTLWSCYSVHRVPLEIIREFLDSGKNSFTFNKKTFTKGSK